MHGISRAGWWVLVLAVGLGAAPAEAQRRRLRDYAVEIWPDGDSARYRLTLTYAPRGPGESLARPDSGFKFVGPEPVWNLSARDTRDRPLRVRVESG